MITAATDLQDVFPARDCTRSYLHLISFFLKQDFITGSILQKRI